MPHEELTVEGHEDILSIWSLSEDPVLVIGECDVLLTKKSAVLKTYLAEVSERYSQKFHASEQTAELLRDENKRLASQNRRLAKNLRELTTRIETIEKRISELSQEDEVVVLKEITRDEAKNEIRRLFKTDRVLYYSDIAKELKIDLEMVVEICEELLEKGEIGISENSL